MVFIYLSISLPALPGTPNPKFPLHSQRILEALQATNNVGVFIYRAYDFNFSIKKSEQGWGKCAVLCCAVPLWGDGRDGSPRLLHTVS